MTPLLSVSARRGISTPLGRTPPDKEPFPIGSTPIGKVGLLAAGLDTPTVPRGLLGYTPRHAQARMMYVRNRLLLGSTPKHVKDRVWTYVANAARTYRGDWNLFALGLAYPGLRARAYKLTPPPVAFDAVVALHFRLMEEFLFALHRLSPDSPNVISRLVGAAYDQASERKRTRRVRLVNIEMVERDELEAAMEREHLRPTNRDPRSVLDRLVRKTANARDGYRITAQNAELIARTYLDGEALKATAAELSLSEANASKRRKRTAALIAHALGRPDLAQL